MNRLTLLLLYAFFKHIKMYVLYFYKEGLYCLYPDLRNTNQK